MALIKAELDRPHPELREGEVFLTNATESGYRSIGHTTKRRGIVAYQPDGTRTPAKEDLTPVFVHKTELDAKGIKCRTEYSLA